MDQEAVKISAKEIAADEKQRLTSLLFDCGVKEEIIDALEAIIDNTVWMKAKLDETRAQIGNLSVAIPYDNGGGQTGIRENLLFKGYSALWKSYMSGMNVIMSHLPQQVVEKEAEQIDTPKTVLQLVRDKHRKNA